MKLIQESLSSNHPHTHHHESSEEDDRDAHIQHSIDHAIPPRSLEKIICRSLEIIRVDRESRPSSFRRLH